MATIAIGFEPLAYQLDFPELGPGFHYVSVTDRPVRLVLFSDTHELHREVDPIPAGDILLFAGDFSFFGQSRAMIKDFDVWLGELPHRHKIIVLGNHESTVATDVDRAKALIANGLVLWDELVDVMGLRIWGAAPPASSTGLDAMNKAKPYVAIPNDLDILVTHEPPRGILDAVPPSGHHAGSRELFDVIRRVRPRLHVFGHIHAGYGWFDTNITTFVNASLMGPDGDLVNRPVVLQMSRRRA